MVKAARGAITVYTTVRECAGNMCHLSCCYPAIDDATAAREAGWCIARGGWCTFGHAIWAFRLRESAAHVGFTIRISRAITNHASQLPGALGGGVR
jgi:hypothetical protein